MADLEHQGRLPHRPVGISVVDPPGIQCLDQGTGVGLVERPQTLFVFQVVEGIPVVLREPGGDVNRFVKLVPVEPETGVSHQRHGDTACRAAIEHGLLRALTTTCHLFHGRLGHKRQFRPQRFEADFSAPDDLVHDPKPLGQRATSQSLYYPVFLGRVEKVAGYFVKPRIHQIPPQLLRQCEPTWIEFPVVRPRSNQVVNCVVGEFTILVAWQSRGNPRCSPNRPVHRLKVGRNTGAGLRQRLGPFFGRIRFTRFQRR